MNYSLVSVAFLWMYSVLCVVPFCITARSSWTNGALHTIRAKYKFDVSLFRAKLCKIEHGSLTFPHKAGILISKYSNISFRWHALTRTPQSSNDIE